MSRLTVGALFAIFTASTVAQLAEQLAHAIADPGLRPWLVVGFWMLKVAIAAAFTYFVLVRPPARRPAREVVAYVACAAAVLSAIAPQGPSASASTTTLLVSELLALAGAVWMLASVLALGRCFGFLPEARGLITRGPYRLVRHPLYLGELTIAAALLLAAPTAWNWLAAVMMLVAQLVRMRLEERALWREFPAYGAYAARTPRILPGARRHPRRAGALAALALGLLAVGVLHPSPVLAKARHSGRLAAPRQLTPADGASVAAVPSFGWRPVRRAAKYEFQLAADRSFRSVVDHGSFFTNNTYATLPKTLADGDYFWRARAITAKARAGRWSPVRVIHKAWRSRPVPLGPVDGASVQYPRTPLVLRWSPVPYAYKYVVTIATDPGLAHSALGDRTPSIETSGTVFALPGSLAPGRYYWGVTPLDADKHPGAASPVASFEWSWPSQTRTYQRDMRTDPRLPDPAGRPRYYDPQLSWDPVPGAARYQVEVNPDNDFAAGSRVCCDDIIAGTSISPPKALPNNSYYWRVRALDVDGNAGVWNYGPGWDPVNPAASFRKDFDALDPTIPNLHVTDNSADGHALLAAAGSPPATSSPVVSWDPVPGASSYEVWVVPTCQRDKTGACVSRSASAPCDWAAPANYSWRVFTASTSWTPLGPVSSGSPIARNSPQVSIDAGKSLIPGASYCARVTARTDRDASFGEVRSAVTQLGGAPDGKAFTYTAPPACDASTTPASMTDADYHPASDGRASQQTFAETFSGDRIVTGTLNRRMPLLTWRPPAEACGYFVVVARDQGFTNIVDVAETIEPAYAPRTGFGPTTYSDETTTYYWVVLPLGGNLDPTSNAPQAFQKRSAPPALLAPGDGAAVSTQPTFQWTLPRDEEGRPEGVLNYSLQIDDDPTFGSPIVDVVTDSTAYTATESLPADTALYWRVRANAETTGGQNKIGLAWSRTGTFRRQLPIPALTANPTGGDDIPVLSWSPVQGAVSYDMHVEQADGTKRDFNMRSTAFTPTIFYGTGVWHWQVRANFQTGLRAVSGGYAPPQPFARHIATPASIRAQKANNGVLLSWAPATMAHRYRVQIAVDDSFSTIIEQATVANTSYAPLMTHPAFADGRRLYWRVATEDEGFNLGGWASAPLRNARSLHLKIRAKLRHGHVGRLRVTVTRGRRRVVSGASVQATGAGVFTKPRKTNRRGRLTLRVRPFAKGKLKVTAEKRGSAPATATVRVR